MKSFKGSMKAVCGFCSGQVTGTNGNITETHMDMIQILLPDLVSTEKLLEVKRLNGLKICRSCDIIISEIFKFKSTCLELEDTIYNYKTEYSEQLDLKKILGLTEDSFSGNQICRTCFGIINNDLFVFICNDNTLIKQHQEKCLSEVDLSLTRKPAMCIDCVEMLQKYFNFISLCLTNLRISTNEKKIENNKSTTNSEKNTNQHKTEQIPTEYTDTGAEPDAITPCLDISKNNKEQEVEVIEIVIEDSDDDNEINHSKHQAIKNLENGCLIDVMNSENVHNNKNQKLRLENQNVREMCLISNLRGSVPDDEYEIANKSKKVISNDICEQNNSDTYGSQKSVLISHQRDSILLNEFEAPNETTEEVDVDNKRNNYETYEFQKIDDHSIGMIPVDKPNIPSRSTEVKTNGIREQNKNEFILAEDSITENYASTNSGSNKCHKDHSITNNNNVNFCGNDKDQICIDCDQKDNDDIFIEDDTIIIPNNELEAVTVNSNNNSNATDDKVQKHIGNDKYLVNETIYNYSEDITVMEDENAIDDVIIIENGTSEKNNSPSIESNKTNKYKRKLTNNTENSMVLSSDRSYNDDVSFDPIDELEYINRRPLKRNKYYYCKICRSRKKTELEMLSHMVLCEKRQTKKSSMEATVFNELQQLRAQVNRLERLQSSATQDHNKKQKTNSFVAKQSKRPLLADTVTSSDSVLRTSNCFNLNPCYSSFKQTAKPVLRLILTPTNILNTPIMIPSFSNNPADFICLSSNNNNNTPAESQMHIGPTTKSLCRVPLIETAFPETLHTQANSYFLAPNSSVTAAHETISKTILLEHTSTTPLDNMQHLSKSRNTRNISTSSSSITIISDEEKSLETIDIVDDETPSNLVLMEDISDNEAEVRASELDPLEFTRVPTGNPIINLDKTKAKNVKTAPTETEPCDASGSIETDLSRECQTVVKKLPASSSKVNQRSELSFVKSYNLTEDSNDMNSIISDLVNVLGYDSTSSTLEKPKTDIVIDENNEEIFSGIISDNVDCGKKSNINRSEQKSNNEFTTKDNKKISKTVNENKNGEKRSKIDRTNNSDKIELNLSVNIPKNSSIITYLNPKGYDERNVWNDERTFDKNRRIDIPIVLSSSSISTTNSNSRLSHQFQTPLLTKRRPVQVQVYRSLSVKQLIDKSMLYTVLNHHMIKHYTLAVFKCDLCTFNTRYFRLIGLHILTHYNSLKENDSYKCDKCNDKFLNKLKLNQHFGADHLSYSYKPLFWCVNCAQSFSCEIGVKNHRISCARKDILVKLFKCSNVVYCMLCRFETTNSAKAKMHGIVCKERNMFGNPKL